MQDFIEDELDDNLDDLEPIIDNPAELYEHFRVVVDKGQKQVRIDKYLFERLVNSSRNRIQKAADAGFVMANGKPVKLRNRGEELKIPYTDERFKIVAVISYAARRGLLVGIGNEIGVRLYASYVELLKRFVIIGYSKWHFDSPYAYDLI